MKDAIPIALSRHNIFSACMVGVGRQIMGMGKKQRWGQDGRASWQSHLSGAIGEMVVAKWRGIFWDGAMGNFAATDVGLYQVRSTPYPNGHLILHPTDKDPEVFILVLAHDEPKYWVRGWIYARDGKLKKYWGELQSRRPAFNVPQEVLEPIATLPILEKAPEDSEMEPTT